MKNLKVSPEGEGFIPIARTVKGATEQNDNRWRFVDRETIVKVLDACPDVEWRLIVALARFGGVRTPSETLGLRWADIDWEQGRFTVTSPKTKKQGKPYRIVPLFPELRDVLADAFEQAKDGAEFVITRYRQRNSNLRTQFSRILKRAGVEPWPRLFQNLRASRETELADAYPLHVVTAWLGNTPRVASKHYLQTTEQHFQRAAGERVQMGATGGAVDACQGVNRTDSETAPTLENTGKAVALEESATAKAPRVGLEPTTQRLTAACSTN